MPTHETRSAHEADTLAEAHKHRDDWTVDDLEFVAAFTSQSTDAELALALGRSLYAIESIHATLEARLTTRRAKAGAAARPCNRTYTFIGDDVPADW